MWCAHDMYKLVYSPFSVGNDLQKGDISWRLNTRILRENATSQEIQAHLTPSLLYSPKASLLASTWPTGTVGRSSSSPCPEISNPTFEPVFVVAQPRRGLSSAVSSTKKSTFGLAKTSAMCKSMLQQRWKRGGGGRRQQDNGERGQRWKEA